MAEKQEQFTRLIAQGVSNAQACRTVGINRRTGTRWRFGRTVRNVAGEPVHYPPVCTSSLSKPRHPRLIILDGGNSVAEER
ncbi:helix-turn-helix domain-containing protein [Leekyejoonella antrihumi]|uniref:helix-turn-helix domain-containing protein n=1 Tax=Leekyejoonella antrihumi TaxID=1660198 RepID=UPI001644D683|nr:helix-turn-helix domain-containing protein [Leekyejoonella antrihumi]